MSSNPLALAARISRHLSDIEKVVNHCENIYQKATQNENQIYFEAIALNLHGFYMGSERIFEDIARTLDKNMPSGYDWHHLLLQQMSLDLQPIRPPIIQEKTYQWLNEYRRFRHVVRHGYKIHLKINKVEVLAEALRDCFTAVQQDLNNFIQFLHQLAND